MIKDFESRLKNIRPIYKYRVVSLSCAHVYLKERGKQTFLSFFHGNIRKLSKVDKLELYSAKFRFAFFALSMLKC